MTVGSMLECGARSVDAPTLVDSEDETTADGNQEVERPHSFWQTTLLFCAAFGSLSLGCWGVSNPDAMVAYARDNRFSTIDSSAASPAWVALGAVASAAMLCCVGHLCWPKARAQLAVLARWCAPLILAAFLPALFSWRLWSGRDLTQLLFAAALVLATKKLVYFAVSTPTLGGGNVTASEGLRDLWQRLSDGICAMRRVIPSSLGMWLVVSGVLWYSAFFSYHTIVHHRNILSASFDLGLEENIIYNVLHLSTPILKSSPLGGPTASHLGSHATWFAFLIAPLYALWPKTETLLVLQAVLMGAAAIPLFLLARRHVSTSLAVFVAYLYLLYPGLHGANLYDFHYLPLGPFFLWYVLYFIEKKRWVLVAILAVISLSVREDVAVSLGFLGGLWLLAGRRPIAALSMLILGAGYFVVMKGVVMHRAFGGDAFVHQYKLLIPDGDRGFSGVIKTILSNPLYTLSTMLERQKLVYFLQIMLPLSFFPLRRFIGLWASVPGLLFALFSTEYAPLLMISFQYTTYWTAQLFPAMVLNLRWMDERVRSGKSTAAWKWSWIVATLVGCLATTYQYGALLQHNTTVGGFGRYHFGADSSDLKRREELGKILPLIPRDAKVVATENVVPQFASRPDAYTLRFGIFDADYIVFRLPTSGDERRHVVQALEHGKYGVVIESGEFVMAKRGASTDQNEHYIARMGGRHHVDD